MYEIANHDYSLCSAKLFAAFVLIYRVWLSIKYSEYCYIIYMHYIYHWPTNRPLAILWMHPHLKLRVMMDFELSIKIYGRFIKC